MDRYPRFGQDVSSDLTGCVSRYVRVSVREYDRNVRRVEIGTASRTCQEGVEMGNTADGPEKLVDKQVRRTLGRFSSSSRTDCGATSTLHE